MHARQFRAQFETCLWNRVKASSKKIRWDVLQFKLGTCNINWCMSTQVTTMCRAKTDTKFQGILKQLPLMPFRRGAKNFAGATVDWKCLRLPSILHSHAWLRRYSFSANKHSLHPSYSQIFRLHCLSSASHSQQTKCTYSYYWPVTQILMYVDQLHGYQFCIRCGSFFQWLY